MRIWSIHPEYLDTKGLVALWRETLLAKNVLQGKTAGYKNHPQLIRFNNSKSPVSNIDYYLQVVYEEATRRGFVFDKHKFRKVKSYYPIEVTYGQLLFEKSHLLNKLIQRDPALHHQLKLQKDLTPHPLFKIINGPVEEWERL